MGDSFAIQGHFITVRNNIFLNSASYASNPAMASISYDSVIGSPMPDQLYFYNNSMYSARTGGTTNGITIAPTLTTGCNIFVENNLAYKPGSGGAVLISNSGSCRVAGAAGTYGNSSDAQMAGTNPYPGTPSAVIDFRPALGYAIDGITNDPQDLFPAMHDDFAHCKSKTSTLRSGAFCSRSDARCFGAK